MTEPKQTTRQQIFKQLIKPNENGTYWYSQSELMALTGRPQSTISKTIGAIQKESGCPLTTRASLTAAGKAFTEIALTHCAEITANAEQTSRAGVQINLKGLQVMMEQSALDEAADKQIIDLLNQVRIIAAQIKEVSAI